MTQPKRLGYLGPAGTNTELACIAYDGAAVRIPYPSIPEVGGAVESRSVDEGVVPIENSVGGSVSITLDLLIHGSGLSIRNELVSPITHSLLGRAGTKLADIRVIYSHPQALEQCRGYIASRLPAAEMVASLSTSAAVEEMLAGDLPSAAIATEHAGVLYGASVLERGIEDFPNNMTRFVVLATADHRQTGDDKTSICFAFDDDAPGILYSVIGEFATRGINLAKIESRPTREALGRYIFLVDLEGHRHDAIVREALQEIESQTSTLKVFGSYPRYEMPTPQG